MDFDFDLKKITLFMRLRIILLCGAIYIVFTGDYTLFEKINVLYVEVLIILRLIYLPGRIRFLIEIFLFVWLSCLLGYDVQCFIYDYNRAMLLYYNTMYPPVLEPLGEIYEYDPKPEEYFDWEADKYRAVFCGVLTLWIICYFIVR